MNIDPVANTYAQALLEAAGGKGLLGEVQQESVAISRLIDEDPAFRVFIENPRIERSVKHDVLESTFRGKVSDLMLNFMLLLVDKGRQSLLRSMLAAFRTLHDRKVGLVRAGAISAVALDDEVLESLRSEMSAKLGKTVEVTNRVDPSLLGGLVVRFDGQVADGSLKTALRAIRSSLSALKFGTELIHENQS